MKKYTREDWQRDREFKAVAGQEIDEEIYNEMFNVLPPLRLPSGAKMAGFRVSEPYTHRDGKPLYMAFGNSGGKYFYLGLM